MLNGWIKLPQHHWAHLTKDTPLPTICLGSGKA